MIDLTNRSCQKELLDDNDIPFALIQQNLQELNIINTHLGGHAISITGIKKILSTCNKHLPITICEIGSGGGDNLNAINKWCLKQKIEANFIGVDINAECINFSKEQYPDLPCRWVLSNYKDISFTDKPTIIFSSLFCHHFKEAELVFMLQWMRQNVVKGFFINDLHRHWLAYYSIRLITRLFSKSSLVKNDAPISVARGFLKQEWQKLILEAGIRKYTISWLWAFRYLIVYIDERNR